MPRHDHVRAPNPGSPSGTSRNSRTSSACPPSTGDSWGTAGWPGEVCYEARRQVRTLFCSGLWPAKRPGTGGGGQDWRTAARGTGAEAPRLQIGSKGSWAPGSKCLKRRARERLSGSGQVSGVLTQSLPGYFSHIATVSLQRGGSAFRKLARALLNHVFGTRRGQLV